MTQPDLFSLPVSDPARGRVHRDGHDTEHEAAEAVKPKSGQQRARVLDQFARAGDFGATDYEVGTATGMFRHVAGTRREELIARGWPIVKTERRRPTDTGRNAIVWMLTPEGRRLAGEVA